MGARGQRAQATVEVAVVLPLLVLVLAAVVQVAVAVRDQVHLTRATSAAARALMVDPTEATARSTLSSVGAGLQIESISLSGSRTAGSLLTVSVSARPTRVPVVGAAISSVRLHEELVVRVEGS